MPEEFTEIGWRRCEGGPQSGSFALQRCPTTQCGWASTCRPRPSVGLSNRAASLLKVLLTEIATRPLTYAPYGGVLWKLQSLFYRHSRA